MSKTMYTPTPWERCDPECPYRVVAYRPDVDVAAASGDVVAMVQAFKDMKECE